MQGRQRSIRFMLAATLCFAVLLVAAMQASAQSVSFAARATFAVGFEPGSVAVGDFNGDSDPDLAVANERLRRRLDPARRRGGSFGRADQLRRRRQARRRSRWATSTATRDPDLAVANRSPTTSRSCSAARAGASRGPTDFAAGDLPVSVAVGDFNGDSDPDLAVANQASNNVSILLGGGGRRASPGRPTSPPARTPSRSRSATSTATPTPTSRSRTTAPTTSRSCSARRAAASPGRPTSPPATSPRSVAVGDFNGDSDPDLAVANYGSDNVSILLGAAGGSFTGPTNFAAGAAPPRSRWATSTATPTPTSRSRTTAPTTSRSCSAAPAAASPAPTNFAAGVEPQLGRGGRLQRRLGPRPGGRERRLRQRLDPARRRGRRASAGRPTSPPATAPRRSRSATSTATRDPDLAVANHGSDNVSILLGGAGGSFGAATNFAAGTTPPLGRGRRLQRRRRPRPRGREPYSDNVSILLGGGAASFSAPTNFAVGDSPRSVAVGDFNGDSDPDLAVANQSPTTSRSCSAARAALHRPDQLRRRPAPPRSRWATSTATPTPTSRSPTPAPTTSRSCSETGAGASPGRPTSPSGGGPLRRGRRLERRLRPRPCGREPHSPATSRSCSAARAASFTGPTNFAVGSCPARSRSATSTATPTPTSRSPTSLRQRLGPARRRGRELHWADQLRCRFAPRFGRGGRLQRRLGPRHRGRERVLWRCRDPAQHHRHQPSAGMLRGDRRA